MCILHLFVDGPNEAPFFRERDRCRVVADPDFAVRVIVVEARLQPGDRFELLVEKQYRDGHVFAGYGPILAAEFDNAGRRFRAVRFTPPGGAATSMENFRPISSKSHAGV